MFTHFPQVIQLGPKPTVQPSVPLVVKGAMGADIVSPDTLRGPTMGYLGVYVVSPDATITVKFKGEVQFPTVGKWEIGLVNNVEVSSVEEKYSQGGRFRFFVGVPLLDVDTNQGNTDIWMDPDPANDGFKVVDVDVPNKVVKLEFEFTDAPGTRMIPGMRDRCKKTISEQILSVKRTQMFRTALVARKDGQEFQLAVTDVFGYAWVLTVPSGGGPPDDDWLDFEWFPSKLTQRPPFKQLLTAPPFANEFIAAAVRQASVNYDSDCSKSANP
jgi:hypothetical protein